MKYLLVILFLVNFANNRNIFCSGGEVWINNISNEEVRVRIIPVSAIFNNDNLDGVSYANYNLLKTSPSAPNFPQRRYLTSINENQNTWFAISPNTEKYIDFDQRGGSPEGTEGSIGFGVYKFEFYWGSHQPDTDPADDYFTIEYDWGYTNNNRNISGCTGQAADIFIRFTNFNTGHPRIQYVWFTCQCAHSTPYIDIPTDRKLYERNRGCDGQNWAKELGNFKYNNGSNLTPNPYSILPLDPRRDCNLNYPDWPVQNHYYFDDNVGKIMLSLTIEKNITTPIQVWDYQYYSFPPIIVTNEAILKLGKGSNNQKRYFTFKKYNDFYAGTELIVEANSKLELEDGIDLANGSRIDLNDYGVIDVKENATLKLGQYSEIFLSKTNPSYIAGKMILRQNSTLDAAENSEIQIFSGSRLINCGANFVHISGINCILVHNGGTLCEFNCSECGTASGEHVFTNGAFLVVAGGTVEVGAGSKLVFDGPDSKLTALSGSIIKLGQNASLEFRNGAYIDANGCTFTSLNSTEG